jgi:hypothetical protein
MKVHPAFLESLQQLHFILDRPLAPRLLGVLGTQFVQQLGLLVAAGKTDIFGGISQIAVSAQDRQRHLAITPRLPGHPFGPTLAPTEAAGRPQSGCQLIE